MARCDHISPDFTAEPPKQRLEHVGIFVVVVSVELIEQLRGVMTAPAA